MRALNVQISSAPACWVISDGAAGNERQAGALAAAMGLLPRVLRIHTRQPWDALSPRLLRGAQWAIRDADGRALESPWPSIAIGCGRRAALLVRALRHWSGGACFGVQILDPRMKTRAFDVVIAPAHDALAGRNVITSIGSLNAVDAGWLAAGRAQFPEPGMFPAPRHVVLIGASHRAQPIDARYLDALLAELSRRHAREGGSFLVSTSRRTPASTVAYLRCVFAQWPGLFWAGEADGENPYAGLLGWADALVVTPDSVNMLSEACATGKPVFTLATHPLRGKLASFHARLRQRGLLHDLDDPPMPTVEPLRETASIAGMVKARWQATPKA